MKKPSTARRRKLFDHLATLAVAFAGGAAFAFLGVPAGWLSGALIACALGAMCGLPLAVHRRLRDGVFILLGLSMGTSVTPATLASLPKWPLSVGLLIVSIPVMMVAAVLFLERIAGWDRRSGFFASVPGALSATLIMSEAAGADMRRVVFGQVLRLLVLVAFVPAAIVASGYSGAVPADSAKTAVDIPELLLALAVGIAGGLAGLAIRLPAGGMVGAMLASGVLYGTGAVEQAMPPWLLVLGFVVLGANSGSRFAGTSFATLRAFLLPALVAIALASAVALVFAVLAATLTGEPLPKLVLAYMPGALEAMVIMAFVLDVDPAFVAAHHLARFLFIALSLPFIGRLFVEPRELPGDDEYAADDEVKD